MTIKMPQFDEPPAKQTRVSRVLGFVAIPLLLAQFGVAQIQLVASSPQSGAVIHGHDVKFSLRFNKRIDNAGCSVGLRMPTGEQRTLSLQAQTDSDQIDTSGMILGNGSYILNWKISTPGNPALSGTVSFSVR